MDGMVPRTRLDSNLPYVHGTIVGLGGSGERGLGLRYQLGFDAVHVQVGNRVGEDGLGSRPCHRISGVC